VPISFRLYSISPSEVRQFIKLKTGHLNFEKNGTEKISRKPTFEPWNRDDVCFHSTVCKIFQGFSQFNFRKLQNLWIAVPKLSIFAMTPEWFERVDDK